MILHVRNCNSIEIAFSWLDSNWDCSKEPWGMGSWMSQDDA